MPCPASDFSRQGERRNGLPGVPLWVVSDKGLAAHSFRERIWAMGARPAIPAQSNE
jgi:hypothetical protein